MANCPSACGDITLISNPPSNCETSLRQTTPSRFIYFACNADIPDTINTSNIKALFDSGVFVATSPLANITWNDPQYEDIQVDDCNPNQQYITSREVTFEDRTAVTADSDSPAIEDEYHDYDFWQDKLDNQAKLYSGVIYCNGDVKLFKDSEGNYLTGRVTGYLNYQRPGTGGGKFTEFKRLSFTYNGDPLGFTNKVVANIDDAGVVL
jgi:hypothetical protein